MKLSFVVLVLYDKSTRALVHIFFHSKKGGREGVGEDHFLPPKKYIIGKKI